MIICLNSDLISQTKSNIYCKRLFKEEIMKVLNNENKVKFANLISNKRVKIIN